MLFSHESEILRKLRLIEGLKADLISSMGELFQAMAKNSEQAIREGLAAVVMACYVLGRRLGVDFAALDEAVMAKVQQKIKQEPEIEQWFGDYSDYQRHLRQRR